MPARIILVHDDDNFREYVIRALEETGYRVTAFAGSMEGIGALEADGDIALLITRVQFLEGTPNGVSLARMARVKKPGVRILLAARDENREHTEGVSGAGDRSRDRGDGYAHAGGRRSLSAAG